MLEMQAREYLRRGRFFTSVCMVFKCEDREGSSNEWRSRELWFLVAESIRLIIKDSIITKLNLYDLIKEY
jgi:hypothetical protein